ncbi:MAG: HD family phosphohydrolase [Heteroscytonema crispum UTEX LB 1556]
MKTQRFFQSLSRQLTHCRRRCKALRRRLLSTTSDERCKERKEITKTKSSIFAVGLGCGRGKRSPVIFAIAVVSLTGVMGHKLYNQPQMKVGMIAPQTMKAPYAASIEDRQQTEAHRKAASKSSVPILMVDARMNEKIDQDLRQLLDRGNEIRAVGASFPFFDTLVLSVFTQHYLRSCSNAEWQALVLAVNNSNAKPKSGVLMQNQKVRIATQGQRSYATGGLNQNLQPATDEINRVSTNSQFPTPNSQHSANNSKLLTPNSQLLTANPQAVDLSRNTEFTQAVAELQAYRLIASEQNLSALINQISQARQGYAEAKTKLLKLATANPETAYDENLLDLSDDDWAQTQMGTQQSAERILTQGIPPGLPPNILQDAVSLQVQTLVPKNAEPLAVKLLLAVLKPNLKNDEVQTKLLSAQKAAQVQPVMVAVRKGEVIVRKGEQITALDFDVLEKYRLIRREIKWLGLMQLGGVITCCIGVFTLVERQIKCRLRQRDRLLILLLTISTPALLTMGTPYTTWSAVGLLLGSFYGPTLGMTVVGLMLVVLPISLEISKIALLAGAAAAMLASCSAQRMRSREELALLGVAIALTQGGVYLLLNILMGTAFGSTSYIVLQTAGLFALSGLSWSIVALGLSPYLEKLFDLVTSIRLSELANPNRPLLKRLATETPGTFQHTLFVATLAEAAAKQLGCNVELVRAGTLYHDIGKMHDPLGFIENQMGGPNKHDTEINDPWKSAEIIKKHVTEGLVMARKHSLPAAIQAFIPEHQGTMAIAYFYHQAQQMAKEDPSIKLDEADFRYDGPIPQSRETAIVMLADSCEAALRSLKDTTPEKVLAMVNNILRAKLQDNQMVDSGLTRAEMSKIAEIFVEVWQQFHHKRIAYPKLKGSNEKCAK